MGACMLISGLAIMAGGKSNGIGAVVMLYMFQVCLWANTTQQWVSDELISS
jgi:hypothetical protein